MIQTLLEWVIEFIGEYEPISYVYSVGADTVAVVPSGAAGVNWPWIAGACLLVGGFFGAIILIKAFLQGVFRN